MVNPFTHPVIWVLQITNNAIERGDYIVYNTEAYEFVSILLSLLLTYRIAKYVVLLIIMNGEDESFQLKVKLSLFHLIFGVVQFALLIAAIKIDSPLNAAERPAPDITTTYVIISFIVFLLQLFNWVGTSSPYVPSTEYAKQYIEYLSERKEYTIKLNHQYQSTCQLSRQTANQLLKKSMTNSVAKMSDT